MRRGGTAKQRVWVGPGRYRRCRGNTFTNRDAKSYSNGNRYACCMRAGKPNPDGNADSDCGWLQLVGRSGHAYSASQSGWRLLSH